MDLKIIKKITSSKIYSGIVALILISIVWILILVASRSLFSGFHFTDDSEVVNINAYFSGGGSFFSVARGVIENDLRIRFRPFYFFYRVWETKMFGSNFFIWSLHNFLLAIVTTFIFFVSFRLLRFSFWVSLFSVFLLQLGPQACIWWRLGPNETIGIFLFSLTFLFLILSSQKKSIFFRGAYIFFAILMSLCKESFVILLPAIYFLKVFLSVKNEQLSWKKSFKKHLWDGAILFFVMFAELYTIIFYVGTNKIGYAGVDRMYYLGYVYIFVTLFKANNIGWLIVTAFLFNLYSTDLKGNFKQKFISLGRELLPLLILAALVIGPQVILYTKSGLYDRYMTPGIFGFVIVFAFLAERILNKSKSIMAVILLGIMTILAVGSATSLAFNNSRDFAEEGYNTHELLHYLDPKNGQLQDKYMIVTDPNLYPEWSYAIGTYVKYELKNDQAYVFPLLRKEPTPFSDTERKNIENFGQELFANRRFSQLTGTENFSTIVIFPRMEKTFLQKYPMASELSSDYKRIEVSDFIVYKK